MSARPITKEEALAFYSAAIERFGGVDGPWRLVLAGAPCRGRLRSRMGRPLSIHAADRPRREVRFRIAVDLRHGLASSFRADALCAHQGADEIEAIDLDGDRLAGEQLRVFTARGAFHGRDVVLDEAAVGAFGFYRPHVVAGGPGVHDDPSVWQRERVAFHCARSPKYLYLQSASFRFALEATIRFGQAGFGA